MVKENNNPSEVTGNSFENIDSLKANLQQISNEIETVRSSFCKGTENLEKIQSMLDAGHLDDFTSMIELFEDRVSSMEREKEDAVEGARKYSEELGKEKERLIKLWDAYKLQEDELAAKDKKITDLQDRTQRFETVKKRLEEEFNQKIESLSERLKAKETELGELDEYRTRFKDFDRTRNRLEEKIHSLQNELNGKEKENETLQNENKELRPLKKQAEYKEKYEETSELYEKERERLSKLYRIYEETDAKCKKLEEELDGWHSWFDSNEEIFSKLFNSAEELRSTIKKRGGAPTIPKMKTKEGENKETKKK
jgi:chromosome segregation ATPase